ncbi:WhiB family transcriptional regulator [Streptomyces sp. NPDC127166]|uniref:WhiB family transcriptional regulator n=1 Tax=Streptomyces sp. NPDC127166 TaxID=3345380 RepID=UPI0036415049
MAGGSVETEWQERALCAQTDPELFHPELGHSCREARKVCGACEVRAECLAHALAVPETDGVWGGLTYRERRRLRPGRGVAA